MPKKSGAKAKPKTKPKAGTEAKAKPKARPKVKPKAAKARPKATPKAKARPSATPKPKPRPARKAAPKPRVEDLRTEERFPERIPIALHFEGAEGKVEHGATTIDISIFGLQIETHGKLEPGQRVLVPTFGDCVVVWVRTVGPDKPFQAGLKMVK